MSKHTAGPWFITGHMTKFVEAKIVGGFIQEVAAVGPTDADGGYGSQQEANAALIAAAPDLLEALMMARDALATALRTAAPDWFATKADIATHVGIKQIDAAIAKATGEAQ